jgi:hypothetical protein
VEQQQMKGKHLFQTNLIVNFTNGESKTYLDVHPDQSFFIHNEMLTLETSNGEMIWYIPAVSIIDYYTECVRVA